MILTILFSLLLDTSNVKLQRDEKILSFKNYSHNEINCKKLIEEISNNFNLLTDSILIPKNDFENLCSKKEIIQNKSFLMNLLTPPLTFKTDNYKHSNIYIMGKLFIQPNIESYVIGHRFNFLDKNFKTVYLLNVKEDYLVSYVKISEYSHNGYSTDYERTKILKDKSFVLESRNLWSDVEKVDDNGKNINNNVNIFYCKFKLGSNGEIIIIKP